MTLHLRRRWWSENDRLIWPPCDGLPGLVFALHRATPDPECVVGHGIGPAMTAVYDQVEAALRRELAKTTLEDVLRDVLRAA